MTARAAHTLLLHLQLRMHTETRETTEHSSEKHRSTGGAVDGGVAKDCRSHTTLSHPVTTVNFSWAFVFLPERRRSL